MNKFLTLSASSALLLSAFLITGCSSDDSSSGSNEPGISYDGNTLPAAINDSNVETIGKTAGESVQVANTSTNLPTSIEVGSSVDMALINNVVLSIINSSNLPAGGDVSAYYCDSGSATASDSFPDPSSGEYNSTITFSNCLTSGTDLSTGVDYSITMNGTVITHFDNFFDFGTGTGFSFTYSNFTVTDNINGTSSTINMTFACTNSADFNTCTYSTDFIGGDGLTHRIAKFDVSYDGTYYNGTATFYHYTYGEVSIVITDITYGSCGALPNGGTISYSSTDGFSSGTITFSSDCTVSGSWANSGGSGSYPI